MSPLKFGHPASSFPPLPPGYWKKFWIRILRAVGRIFVFSLPFLVQYIDNQGRSVRNTALVFLLTLPFALETLRRFNRWVSSF